MYSQGVSCYQLVQLSLSVMYEIIVLRKSKMEMYVKIMDLRG